MPLGVDLLRTIVATDGLAEDLAAIINHVIAHTALLQDGIVLS